MSKDSHLLETIMIMRGHKEWLETHPRHFNRALRHFDTIVQQGGDIMILLQLCRSIITIVECNKNDN